MTNLLLILAALSILVLLHNLIEVWGMSQKVLWLKLTLDDKEHGTWPLNINTKFKVISLHASILLIIAGGSYLILSAISPSNRTLAGISITTLLLNYLLTVVNIDKFHTQIDTLIRKYKNNKLG